MSSRDTMRPDYKPGDHQFDDDENRIASGIISELISSALFTRAALRQAIYWRHEAETTAPRAPLATPTTPTDNTDNQIFLSLDSADHDAIVCMVNESAASKYPIFMGSWGQQSFIMSAKEGAMGFELKRKTTGFELNRKTPVMPETMILLEDYGFISIPLDSVVWTINSFEPRGSGDVSFDVHMNPGTRTYLGRPIIVHPLAHSYLEWVNKHGLRE